MQVTAALGRSAASVTKHIKTTQGPLAMRSEGTQEVRKWKILTLGQVFILVSNQAAGESSLDKTLVTAR